MRERQQHICIRVSRGAWDAARTRRPRLPLRAQQPDLSPVPCEWAHLLVVCDTSATTSAMTALPAAELRLICCMAGNKIMDLGGV